MKPSLLVLVAVLGLAACAPSRQVGQWQGSTGAQPFETAYSACQQISYNIEANFITCMAGRGWVKPKK
ncbi:hypothetical protein K1X12_06045 [Hyphomonas sp. WL0036]|uniref:hypothetical protein n=1 Tax=Hyphomonas sediminis TaxID=2866160 RepID=UPI001C81F1A3|nr:hypothetical protein [Hyphomonas sediminis]MBY9066450.1 hypothetical protein [Hyphomonas sediminis]